MTGVDQRSAQGVGAQLLVEVRLFHEMLLKGGNRPLFVRKLRENLRTVLQGLPVGRMLNRSMMALLPLEDPACWPELRDRLEHLLGVERFGRVWRVAPDLQAIRELLARLLEDQVATSFRITARRSDKSFPLNSPQINRELGAYVQGMTGLPVDLEHPDLNIRVHVTPKEGLVGLEEHRGPGGMPVGVGGRVAALLSGGIDSPVAAYRMMQRGCRVLFVHFHSFPLVEGTSREKAQDLVRLLTRYQNRSRLMLVPFAPVQQRVILTVPPAYRVVVYRRLMFRIAQAIALREGAEALVTGESLGQVSSQTLQNLATIGAAADQLLVLRPLIGLDKAAIVAQAVALDTYATSIIPDEDCCSLFVPRHPVTRSTPGEVEALEASLDVEALVREAVESAEERLFDWPHRPPRPSDGG